MFRCSEVAERASLLIDDELGFWPRLNIKLHLVMCRGCRAFISQMRTTDDLTVMAGTGQEPVPGEDLKAALAQRQMRSGRNT
jgi:hypothetical protein